MAGEIDKGGLEASRELAAGQERLEVDVKAVGEGKWESACGARAGHRLSACIHVGCSSTCHMAGATASEMLWHQIMSFLARTRTLFRAMKLQLVDGVG